LLSVSDLRVIEELSQPIATTFMFPAVCAELYATETVAVEFGTAELPWMNLICVAQAVGKEGRSGFQTIAPTI
jgi:hypothetical protein